MTSNASQNRSSQYLLLYKSYDCVPFLFCHFSGVDKKAGGKYSYYIDFALYCPCKSYVCNYPNGDELSLSWHLTNVPLMQIAQVNFFDIIQVYVQLTDFIFKLM